MKVMMDLELDNNEIILNILYDLGREDLYKVDDDTIKSYIKTYVQEEYSYSGSIIVSDTEVQEVKKTFIKYLNNLIKQLS